MGKPRFEFTVKPDNKNRHVRVLVKELDERIKAMIEWLPYLVAEPTLADIERMAPTDVPGYPRMLELRGMHVRGVDSTVAILAPGYSFASKLHQRDAEHTLLFVKAARRTDPKTGGRKVVSQAAVVLANHSPWTMATLPFEPNRKIASVRAIRVTKIEVAKIEALRKKELPGVQQQLHRLGITRLRGSADKIERKVTRDVGFEVLRREFGIHAKSQPHWRPALQAARTEHLDAALKSLVRWFTVPSERRWKKNLVVRQEHGSVLGRIRRFQQALT
jgi:hypothetical protein